VVEKIEFTGRVAPVLEQELFFRTTGRVRNVYAKRDDVVKKGQVLADLEIDDLERERASAILDLERAEQELYEAEQSHADELDRARLQLEKTKAILAEEAQSVANDLTRARVDLAISKIELDKTKLMDPTPAQTKAEADLAEARFNVRQAQLAYDEVAYADDLGTSSEALDLQAATLALERAEADYTLAVQAIDAYQYELDRLEQEVTKAQLEVQRLEGENARKQSEFGSEESADVALAELELKILGRGVDPLFENNVERGRLEVQKLEASIADAQIIAPFDGELLSFAVVAGREGEAYKPVAIIAAPGEVEVSADIPSTQMVKLSENMPIIARLSSRPGEELHGFIRKLPYPYGGGGSSEEVEDEDQSTRITLESIPPDLELEVGDVLRIEVVLERKDNVLWLPPQAIRTFENRRFVVVQEGEAQSRVDVKVGVEGEERVEIEEGLTEGQVVLGP
jgi:multidrug efflux pump subunit AcrA (membrane-fusion protein)